MAVCKTAGSAYVRSNPTPATHLRRSEPVTLECVTGFSRERERLRRPSDVPRGPCVGQIRPSADVGDERSIWRLSCGNDPQRKHLLMPRAGVRGRGRCSRRDRRPRRVIRWRSATTTRRRAAGRTADGPTAWRPTGGRARSGGRRARLRPRRSSVAGPAGSLLLLANRREARVVAKVEEDTPAQRVVVLKDSPAAAPGRITLVAALPGELHTGRPSRLTSRQPICPCRR